MEKEKIKNLEVYENFVKTAYENYKYLFDDLPQNVDFSDDEAMIEWCGLKQDELLDILEEIDTKKRIIVFIGEPGNLDIQVLYLANDAREYYDSDLDFGFYGLRFIFSLGEPLTVITEPSFPSATYDGIMVHRMPFKMLRTEWSTLKYKFTGKIIPFDLHSFFFFRESDIEKAKNSKYISLHDN